MRKIIAYASIAALVMLGAERLAAQEQYVYPARNQSDEQMGRDKEACHAWAVKETGVDPEKVASEATSATKSESGTSESGGGLGGAGLGAARGAMSGDAGAGAIRGVGIGRLFHAIRARRQLEEQHEASTQTHQQRQAQLQKYDRANAACLTGRGYTVQ